MTKPRFSPLWFSLTLLVVAAGGWFGFAFFSHSRQDGPVAAYLLPIGQDCRVKFSWRFAKKIYQPIALHSGETVSLLDGSAAKLIHAADGAAETVNGPTKITLQQKLPAETATLISPLAEVLAKYPELPQNERRLIITSPAGITRYLNPLIACENGSPPFDVLVVDPADPDMPPRLAKNVRLPISLSALETPQRRQLSFDRNYEIYVRESGDRNFLKGAGRFLTTPDAQIENNLPDSPIDLMSEACAAMAKKPYRTGDAWLALSKLPPEWTTSELGVRLRLLIGTELLSASQIETARKEAAALLRLR